MEVDELRLAARVLEPKLQDRIDRIEREVLGKFKGGTLSQEFVVQLRADWLAATRLLNDIKALGGLND